MPPLSGNPRYNEHADDIDFQIEADVYGLINPVMPASAQKMTWKYGHVMNYGDGVYGGVFVATMYSTAYYEDDPVKVVRAGLAAIPADSNYAKTISDVLKAYAENQDDWRHAWRIVEKNWGDFGNCPTRRKSDNTKPFGIGANINGAYVAIALLYGKRDPLMTMRIASMCGRDTDCNGASSMGILGTILGFKNLPKEFLQDFNMLRGRNFAYTDYDWKRALKAMEAAARGEIVKNGGSEKDIDGKPGFMIPDMPLQTLPLEQWAYGVNAKDVPIPKYDFK
jgi:hypothetical protein